MKNIPSILILLSEYNWGQIFNRIEYYKIFTFWFENWKFY